MQATAHRRMCRRIQRISAQCAPDLVAQRSTCPSGSPVAVANGRLRSIGQPSFSSGPVVAVAPFPDPCAGQQGSPIIPPVATRSSNLPSVFFLLAPLASSLQFPLGIVAYPRLNPPLTLRPLSADFHAARELCVLCTGGLQGSEITAVRGTSRYGPVHPPWSSGAAPCHPPCHPVIPVTRAHKVP